MTFLGALDCFLILSQFNSGYYNTSMNILHTSYWITTHNLQIAIDSPWLVLL